MESPLSHEPSCILWRVIGINNLAESWCLYQVCRWDIGVISCFVLPLTSDDHILRVRTPFGVFLDTVESPLSQDSFHVLWKAVGFHNIAENLCFSPSVHVFWLCQCE